MDELEIHNPFEVPDRWELERYEDSKPRWWYAAQMRMAGAPWDQIARVLGYAGEQTVRAAVKKAKADRTDEELEDIVDLEMQRLDALQMIHWRMAAQGDVKSTQIILAIMTLRMKLLGTEKRPESGEHRTQNNAIFIGGDQASYIDALKTARNAGKAIGATDAE